MVVPLNGASGNDFCLLQDFAQDSNSQMILAQDEFGNHIAVGVVVTDDFAEHDMTGKYLKAKNDAGQSLAQCNIPWVGAVEECEIESTHELPIEKKSPIDNKTLIRVYKSKKARQKGQGKASNSKSLPKTLKQMKKANRLLHSAQKCETPVDAKKYSNPPISGKIIRRRRRKCPDKAYRPTVSHPNVTSNLVFQF